MTPEPLIQWPDPIVELLGFLASFLVVGAVGFRLVAGAALRAPGIVTDAGPVMRDAIRRAAVLGMIGALVSLALLLSHLPENADRQHTTVALLLAHNLRTQVQLGFVLASLLGLALASARVPIGWGLAGFGALLAPLQGGLFGQWARLATPVHRLFAGLWIGTLFMLVAAGLATVLRSMLPSARRGEAVAALVHAFSPLALTSAGLLAVFGAITGWQHLHVLSNLWTTPYGITLIVKLAMVGVVLALGAWNWRRQKPRLGTEAGAHSLRGSATGELAAAFVVLMITAVLVSLPSPRGPGEAPRPNAPPPHATQAPATH
jgi:copper transport protein